MDTAKALKEAIELAVGELYRLHSARTECNGWRNLAKLFEEAGKFAEDGLDEILSHLQEARSYVQELIEENERLKERLEALDIPKERTA